ncbi:Uncharacterized ACR, YdiU/UPF0061 family [Citrobacter koseri]|nr:Uncharacterized ACR, YdiU/UPF0061 family [Citrobacter koseri]
MTLSFTSRWRDELPATYTALSPTPLSHARLIWHNDALAQQLAIPPSLFDMENGAGVWAASHYCPACRLWLRFIAAISLASGPASSVMDAVFC